VTAKNVSIVVHVATAFSFN